MLLKNIPVHSLNLLNFVCIIVFNIETALENAKLVIIEQLQLQIFFCTSNLGQNIQRLFHFLTQFLVTTNETELDHYHQKVNVRVASRVAERLKT